MDVIDENMLQQLIDMDDIDDPSFVTDILGQFFDQTVDVLSQMRKAMNDGDYNTVGKLGHLLKGSSSNVGAAKVRDITNHIQYYEKYAKEEGLSDGEFLSRKIAELEPAIKEAKEAMSQRLGKSL